MNLILRTRKIYFVILLGGMLLLVTNSALCDTESPSTINSNKQTPALLSVLAGKISGVLKESLPEANCSLKTDEFKCEYQTQKFMIHTIYRTGEIDKEAHEELGPSYKGLIVQIGWEEPRQPNAAVYFGPHEVDDLYWKTYIIRDSFENAEIYVWISYGVRTDKKLVERIRHIIDEETKKAKDIGLK